MRHVKIVWIIATFCYSVGFISAQEMVLEGQIMIHNSKFNTGTPEFVKNAQISSFFSNANSCISDELGRFRLVFNGVQPGASIDIEVEKQGLEVVNVEALRDITLSPKTFVKIWMVSQGKLNEARIQYYKINTKVITKKEELKIAKLERENQLKDSIIMSISNSQNKPDEELKQILSERKNKDYAFLFAVNDYDDPDFQDLSNPIKNAKEIAKELSEEYGFYTEVIENPTRIDIKNKIDEILSSYGTGKYPHDGQLLFFLADTGNIYIKQMDIS